MALPYAMLALLSDQPSSGYDLVKTFEESVGFFWKATHQQVYRELSKLEDQGWVNAAVVPQSGRPDKKVYRITDLGQQALTDWVMQSCEMPTLKDELLIKVFVGALVPAAQIQQEIERHRQLHQQRLAVYQAIAAKFFANPEQLPLARRFHYLTLRRGIRYEIDWIGWCDEAVECLKSADLAE
ncbi:MAG TPA: PadR family transcriptional regulator [Chroococcidiopsis sp.]